MGRNAQEAALQSLTTYAANLKKAERAVEKNRALVEACMVRCVKAGDEARARGHKPLATRQRVARIVGLSQSRVAQIAGMPPGKNAVRPPL